MVKQWKGREWMLDWLMLRIIEKCVSKPCFISWKDFHKYLVVLHEIKPVLTLDKPIYVGFSGCMTLYMTNIGCMTFITIILKQNIIIIMLNDCLQTQTV